MIKQHAYTRMSKKTTLVAVLSHSYPSGKSTVNAYVLDGTPEQHAEYRARVATAKDPKRAAVSEHQFEDRDGKFPALKGNPMFYSLEYQGDCVEITIPDAQDQQPRIETMARDREIEVAKKIGESSMAVWKAYTATNEKLRFSTKSKTVVSDEAIDNLESQDKN
jgi:hypothetical protein